MTDGIETITTQALVRALDASTLKHQVHALNIANANTQNYVAQRLSFDVQLQDAARELEARGSISPDTLASATLRIEPLLNAYGEPQPVHLDNEMVEIARNSIHYQALVRGLSRHLSILSIAVGDGRK